MSYTVEQIIKHQFNVSAICIDGEYWEVDYVNIPEDTEDERGNFVCFNREDVYVIDNPKLETKRFYYDELAKNGSVVLLKEVPINESEEQ